MAACLQMQGMETHYTADTAAAAAAAAVWLVSEGQCPTGFNSNLAWNWHGHACAPGLLRWTWTLHALHFPLHTTCVTYMLLFLGCSSHDSSCACYVWRVVKSLAPFKPHACLTQCDMAVSLYSTSQNESCTHTGLGEGDAGLGEGDATGLGDGEGDAGLGEGDASGLGEGDATGCGELERDGVGDGEAVGLGEGEAAPASGGWQRRRNNSRWCRRVCCPCVSRV
jgi:hypothetical protein